jgi:hypothetical protein
VYYFKRPILLRIISLYFEVWLGKLGCFGREACAGPLKQEQAIFIMLRLYTAFVNDRFYKHFTLVGYGEVIAITVFKTREFIIYTAVR